MRFSFWIVTMLIALNASGQTPTSKLWTELKAKREMLPGLHQEFEVTQSSQTSRSTRGSQRKIVLDLSQNKWRELSVSGSSDRIRIFDGQDLFLMEADGDEFVRTKRKAKEDDPQPGPYGSIDLDWTKANELARRPCGFKENDHSCVILDVPVKKWIRATTDAQITRVSEGITRLAIDSETGALVQSNTQELIDSPQGGYKYTLQYSLTRVSYGAASDAALFKLPESGVHEVKELTR
jgi:hypothetical protein